MEVPINEMYKEGSAACRNYSRLTMQVRTLAQNILIGYGVGMTVAILSSFLKADNQEHEIRHDVLGNILFFMGILLVSFSFALYCIDWHYQSAFMAIRDAMAKLEGTEDGPWTAHQKARTPDNDIFASSVPFLILAIAGISSIVVGIYFNNWPAILIIVGVVIIASSIFGFNYIRKKFKKMK